MLFNLNQKNASVFKTFYSELAGNLFKKLPKSPLKFNSEKTNMFYRKLKPNTEKFELLCITEDITNKLYVALMSLRRLEWIRYLLRF